MKEIKFNKNCGIVDCEERLCPFQKECANHTTAGDFRTEDGIRPKLHYRNGKLMCETIDSPIDTRYEYGTFPLECDGLGAVTWHEVLEKTDAYEI